MIPGDFFFLFRLCYGNDRRNIGKSQAIEHIVAGIFIQIDEAPERNNGFAINQKHVVFTGKLDGFFEQRAKQL